MDKSQVTNKFKCPFADRYNLYQHYYIGMTTQTLRKRLNQHCYEGAIKQHLKQDNNTEATKDLLYNNCIIVKSISDQIKLQIYKDLHIYYSLDPSSIKKLIALPDNCHSFHTFLVKSAFSLPM